MPKELTPPGVKTRKILEKIVRWEAPSAGAPAEMESSWPIVWAEGKGAEIKDVEGNTYIDLTAGYSVASAGYCNPKVIESTVEQLGKLTHCKSRTPNIPRAILLEMLSKITPGRDKKIHFATGGAEAVEIALKLAKFYTKRHEIISFYGGWHGRSHAALALSSPKELKRDIYPLLPGVIFLPYPYCYRCPLRMEYPSCSLACVSLIENAIKNPLSGHAGIAAMIVEPIQGYGGHIIPPKEFLLSLQKICKESNIVFIADEIYTGFGRTGKMFAVEHYSIIPDMLILGKALTGCLPLSAIVGRNEIMDACQGTVTSMTFQANPISCAAAIANLKFIQKMKLVEASAEKGEYFIKRLRELAESHEIIGDVRGKGLMIGVELVEDRVSKKPAINETKDLILFATRKGVLVDVALPTNVLRITPPLVITKEQIDRAVEVLEAALARLK